MATFNFFVYIRMKSLVCGSALTVSRSLKFNFIFRILVVVINFLKNKKKQINNILCQKEIQ